MTEPRLARYQWGQRVRACQDLFNDGSYPEIAADALLVNTGDAGEIVNVGTHVDSNTPVYLVEFPANRIVGCLEEEIAAE
jgi:nitrogen fixation protein NifZ